MDEKVAIFGKINVDTFLYIDQLLIGENHLCQQTFVDIGGKGANTAIALAKLGIPCHLIACIGSDSISQSVLKKIEKYGVDTSFIRSCNAQTGKTFVVVESKGRNTMFHLLGANDHLTPEIIDWTFLEKSSAVFVQFGIPFETVREVVTMSKRNGKYVYIDPAGFPDESVFEIIAYADTVAPNETEILKLTKETNLEKAVKKLLSTGVEEVVVKLGSKGASLFTEKTSFHINAYEVNVIDTTGAGDAFNAAYIAGKMKKFGRRETLKLAVAASSICVSKQGTSSASPTKDELTSFLNSIGEKELVKSL
ncbi:MAG: ribokinase [Pseudothermotoga sp.]|uniref:carbohydrate kinase family protein n=1 Tax=Pseudothermotoga TaxID=1643951 RepID=UPI00074661F7|nr:MULTISPECIES: ribokinase [Pseudothermotoga]KUK20950.1 MAG: PfkB domain protein [Pseudothermotoga lettingae]MDI3494516.1 ribokinase [Pseudothermotoga sp.]HBJ80941.1 ribokinase [Pseudothermotoga sp.]HBT26945.1 ribokinase [Pseudothermotoga sp.]